MYWQRYWIIMKILFNINNNRNIILNYFKKIVLINQQKNIEKIMKIIIINN